MDIDSHLRPQDFASFPLELESIYASAPIGLCVLDRQCRYVRVNRILAEMNGFPVEQHLGRTVRELLPNLADFFEALFQEIVETGEARLNIEVTGETPAQPGFVRSWNEHWLPLRNDAGEVIGINIVAEEITEHKRRMKELRQSEERFPVAFATANDAMALSDASSVVIAANEAYFHLYGYAPEEVIDQSFALIFPEEARAQAIEQYQQIFAGELTLPAYEAVVRRKDRTVRIVEARTGFVGQPGEREAMLSVIRDLTERKRLENALRVQYALASALSQAATAADVGRITVEQIMVVFWLRSRDAKRGQERDFGVRGSPTPPARWRGCAAAPPPHALSGFRRMPVPPQAR